MTLETLTSEDIAALRDRVIQAPSEKIAARQKEPLAELERVGGAGHVKALHSSSEASSEVS